MGYYASVLTTATINLMAILSMYVLMGLTGIFSMGQAAFMCVGAYTAGMLAVRTSLPMVVVVVISVGMGMLSAFLVGLPVVKLRRDYIALITLGFGEAIVALLNNLSNVTGGANGINGIPRKMNIYLALGVLAVLIFLLLNFKNSKFGRHCIAIKNDELSAAAMGINVPRIKLLAFVLAGGITALSGCLMAYNTTFIEPMAYGSVKSIDWICFVFVGGVSSLTGTLVSGLIFNLLPEVLRVFSLYRIIVQGAIVLLIINFMPQGLFGEYELSDLVKKVAGLFKKKPAVAGGDKQ
ncbi:branched-chain amino acid ABC transporter permease [Ruminococcaceae bacterium OttesenSCG-928-D13]|nr:branched-chain amino acid ABC transporter permease [Ruminococcaceae bacterium OttesenSCG-928-D13]